MSKGGLLLVSSAALAQTQQPYAGMQDRPIKALSEEQITDLKAGRGMGLALAAELNGYPGPAHAIELAGKIGLTPDQAAKVKALFDAMKAETIPIGSILIEQERALDSEFANRTVTPASLEAATQKIGATQATLRAAHLKYHLATLAILSAEQVTRYNELRGYAGSAAEHHHQMH
jgi:Spy/CpxP family protein refolding chaperone